MIPLSAVSIQNIACLSADPPPSAFTNVTRMLSVPLFDFVAERDGETYVFAACARRKYGIHGKVNPTYHLFSGDYVESYKTALKQLVVMGHNLQQIHYCFLVCPIEEGVDCTYYWGEFTEINEAWTWVNILHGRVANLSVPMSKRRVAGYRVFGSWTWAEVVEKLGMNAT